MPGSRVPYNTLGESLGAVLRQQTASKLPGASAALEPLGVCNVSTNDP